MIPCRHCGIRLVYKGQTALQALQAGGNSYGSAYQKELTSINVGVNNSSAQAQASAGECNIDTAGVCDVIGHKYIETCCACLRRQGVSESIWNNYGCNSCKVRWDNMTDEEKTPIQSAGCCQIM